MTQAHKQLLPRETYFEDNWFEREQRELFAQSWSFACMESSIPDTGDFHTFRFLSYSMFVVRDDSGAAVPLSNTDPSLGILVLSPTTDELLTGAAQLLATVSRFASQYHRLFGELPSDTRRINCVR